MNIYDLTSEYLELLNMLEDPEVDEDVIRDTLEGLDGELEAKADGYAMILKNLEADAKAIKAEEDRLYSRRKSIENRMAYLKANLQTMMELTGKVKFKTPLFSFGIQKNPPKVVITDESRIGHDYLIPQPPKVDTQAIKAALNEGFCFDWAHLEQTESLRIR